MPLNKLTTTPKKTPAFASSESVDKFEWHLVVSNKGDNAINILEQQCLSEKRELSKTELKQAINKGALWHSPAAKTNQTQRLRRIKKPLAIGDKLHFYYNREVLSTPTPNATLIADLVDYSVWYKPYGMLSQGSKWSDHCTIARFAQTSLPNERPAFIVHRLDRAATGLILVAHSKKAARALSAMFEQHQLEKIYHIIVHGNHNERAQPDIIERAIEGKSARSTFKCLQYNSALDQSLIEVKIDSGRKHQIRLHAASIGMPVVGDRLHGQANINEDKNLQLCAVSLRFHCPLLSSQLPQVLKEHFFKLPEGLMPHF